MHPDSQWTSERIIRVDYSLLWQQKHVSPLRLSLGSVVVLSLRDSHKAGVARARIPWAMSVECEGNVPPFLPLSVSEFKCIPIR